MPLVQFMGWTIGLDDWEVDGRGATSAKPWDRGRGKAAASVAPSARGDGRHLLEDCREMGLVLEPALKSDIHEREIRPEKQLRGLLYAKA